MKIKSIIAFLMSVVMITAIMTGCSNKKDKSDNDGKINVVCTIFPEYDWVKQVVGDNDNIDITMLLDNGTDLHSYQPTADDMIKISDCDLFIYVGGESDNWAKDALKTAKNKNMKVINLLDTLGTSVKEEEAIEGMQAEDEHEESEEEPEYDEHVWLSVKNAKTFCNEIASDLSLLDSKNKEKYDANAKAYIEKLDSLDNEYQQTVDNAKRKTLLFGDRFPFRYMTDDYGLSYYAAFVGCSAETEASFETVAFLAKKVDELSLPCVITIEGAQHKIAETIIKNTSSKNQTVLSLDSMQSVTSKDAENGETYLSVMQKNLEVLKTALN